jgi:tetratricopeptide (TPR) repeat protein
MAPTVFLSAVTNEFGSVRSTLARSVRHASLRVVHQDDFANRGVLTLQMLEEEIRGTAIVFHVLGAQSGALAPAGQVRDFLDRHPSFQQRFPDIAADGLQGKVSYTQWEAWLALYFDKRLGTFRIDALNCEAPQQLHAERLRDHDPERKRHPKIVADSFQLIGEMIASLLALHLVRREQLAAPCNLPFSPLGELFIGRGPFLEDLRRRFEAARQQEPPRWPNHAVTGMAGVGKTRLAVEYGWKHQDHYTALLFVNCETPASLGSHLANLAGVLQLDLPADARDPDKRAAVLDWLQRHPGWLLILDNVDDQAARDAVNAYLKDWHAGHLLITGRYLYWGKDVERLGLQVLAPEDARAYLLKSTPERQAHADDAATAQALATDDLGQLCLALEQCSAYVNKVAISLGEYRRRWQQNFKNVRGWADKVLMKYHEEKAVSLSIATTWQTTTDQLSPPARELLHLLCWLAPDPLPQTLLDAVEKQGALPGDVEEAAAELRGFSLLQRSQDCGFAAFGEVHRLVQLITREQLIGEARQTSLPRALAALDAAFIGDPTDVRTWPVLNPLAAHVEEAVRHADAADITDQTSRLMNQLGLLYKQQIRFPDAERLYRRALSIDERSFGAHHPNVAIRLNNLAQLLQATNRLGEAEPLMRRALSIVERSSGADHPNVGISLNNLAALLQATNRLGEAEPLMRRALAIDERSFGADHPNVATYLNNLAQLLQDTNRLGEAEPLMRRALAIDERSFGADHPEVAIDLNNLAQLLNDTNRLEEAEPLMRRALAIDERSFGADHPKVAIRLNNLATLLQATNRLAEAEPLMRRALAIEERSFGTDHPHVATDLNNLAQLLQATNRRAEAEPLMRRAMGIDEQSFGTDHPNVGIDLNNLAQLLQATNRLAEAEPLSRRHLLIFLGFTGRTGHEHPHLRAALANYTAMLKALGRSDADIQVELAKLGAVKP